MGVLPLSAVNPSPSALELFQQGRLSESISRCSHEPDDTLLKAEALIRLGRPNEVVRMDIMESLSDVPREQKYLAQSLLAMAFLLAGMTPQAYTALSAAYDSLQYTKIPGAADHVNYVAAFDHWQKKEYSRAENLLRPMCSGVGVSAAKALSLLSFVEASRERYESQIELLQRAWNVLPLREDVYVGAKILHALAYLSCELYDKELAAFVGRAADQMPWTSDLVHQQIETLRAVAWNHALSGNIVAALRQFRRNEFLANTDTTRLTALLDRARVSNGHEEPANFQAYIEFAEEIAAKINWGNATQDERFSLLTLAALYAPLNPQHARAILERYQSIGTPVSATMAFGNGDKRKIAQEQYAAGVVARFLGSRESAISHMRESFRIYKSLRHYWRAALCAFHLDALGCDPSVMECALIWIREYSPEAWFRPLFRQAERLESSDAYKKLTRVQRSILHLLLRGKSTTEISKELDRVDQTVRNHTTSIYRAFGVHKQQDLIRVCIERRKT